MSSILGKCKNGIGLACSSYVRAHPQATDKRTHPLSTYGLRWARPVSASVFTVRWIGTLSKRWELAVGFTFATVRLIGKCSKLGFFLVFTPPPICVSALFSHPKGAEWSNGYMGRQTRRELVCTCVVGVARCSGYMDMKHSC